MRGSNGSERGRELLRMRDGYWSDIADRNAAANARADAAVARADAAESRERRSVAEILSRRFDVSAKKTESLLRGKTGEELSALVVSAACCGSYAEFAALL